MIDSLSESNWKVTPECIPFTTSCTKPIDMNTGCSLLLRHNLYSQTKKFLRSCAAVQIAFPSFFTRTSSFLNCNFRFKIGNISKFSSNTIFEVKNLPDALGLIWNLPLITKQNLQELFKTEMFFVCCSCCCSLPVSSREILKTSISLILM